MGDLQPNLQHHISKNITKTKPHQGRFAASVQASARDGQDRRLAKACADFEAIFVEQLFKTMRASVPESGMLDGGRAEEIYTSLLDQQIALEMSHGQGSVGLAAQMQNKLTPSEEDGTAAKRK